MIHLSAGKAKYTINTIRGASTCQWSIDGKDIFYIEPKSYAGKQIKFKGGCPVMFPIFSTLKSNGESSLYYNGKLIQLPQHGLARLSTCWRVNQESESSARLYLQTHKESLDDFPFAFELEVLYELLKIQSKSLKRFLTQGMNLCLSWLVFTPTFKSALQKIAKLVATHQAPLVLLYPMPALLTLVPKCPKLCL